MPTLRPRAFLSYRHVEHEAGADIDAHSQRHRAWVQQFANDLRSEGVDVFIDRDLRDLFAQRTAKDPWLIGFLGEMSSICPFICHTFIPILTPSYIERLGYGGYQRQDSTAWSFVLEEWHYAMQLVNGGAMNYVPVIRAGDCERYASLPLGVGPDTAFDMSEPEHYAFQVRTIAQMMLHVWDGDDPLIRADLPGFVDLYTGWCRERGGRRAVEPVEDWAPDALYTRQFFEAVLKR